MTKQRSILEDIPPDLLARYKTHKLSSTELGKLTGFHPAALRRVIKREPRVKQPKNKSALIAARKAFRATLAHLSPKEIVKQAHVSLTTANRIRKLGKENADK